MASAKSTLYKERVEKDASEEAEGDSGTDQGLQGRPQSNDGVVQTTSGDGISRRNKDDRPALQGPVQLPGVPKTSLAEDQGHEPPRKYES